MLSRILVLVVVWALSASVFAYNCNYESILFSYLAKQHQSTEDCFLIDPRDVSAEGDAVLSVKVRERHNKKCGGDPETMPTAGIFRVNTSSCRIDEFNIAEDEYLKLNY